jgi:circadian clock protein KaiC
MDSNQNDRYPSRIASGVPGLDTILQEGFLKDGIYIIQGSPGAGKTILANQICFHHARNGGRILYVTLLAESHARMLLHIGQLGFFDPSLIPTRIFLISAFRVLEEHGLGGLLDLLRREVQAREATVLVLDGVISIQDTAGSPLEQRKFLHELQAQAILAGCTMFLLGSAPSPPIPVGHTMVDGVIQLQTKLYGRRAERHLEVYKMRGTGYLHGEHSYRITDQGLVVYPRTEALLRLPSATQSVGSTIETGIKQLDRMAGGGFPSNSTALLTGPAGIGKTTFGLHFLGQCSEECPGLHFGFYEQPQAISMKADALGLPLKRLIERGQVEILWQPTTEGILDEACHRMLDAVKRRGVRRLFIDGLEGFERLTTDRERLGHVFAALSNELSALGVTTVYTSEAETIGPVSGLPLSHVPLQGVSCIAEVILVMRYVELRAHLHRVIAVVKVRNSLIESAFHKFTITNTGIVIDENASAAEQILAEATQQTELSRFSIRAGRNG